MGVVGGAVVDRRSSPKRKRGWSLVSGTDGNYRNHPKRLRSRPRRSAVSRRLRWRLRRSSNDVSSGVFVGRDLHPVTDRRSVDGGGRPGAHRSAFRGVVGRRRRRRRSADPEASGQDGGRRRPLIPWRRRRRRRRRTFFRRPVGRMEEGGGRRRPSAIVDFMRQRTLMVTGWVDVRGHCSPGVLPLQPNSL